MVFRTTGHQHIQEKSMQLVYSLFSDKDKKIKFNLTIGKEEILTDFDILMVQKNEEETGKSDFT